MLSHLYRRARHGKAKGKPSCVTAPIRRAHDPFVFCVTAEEVQWEAGALVDVSVFVLSFFPLLCFVVMGISFFS